MAKMVNLGYDLNIHGLLCAIIILYYLNKDTVIWQPNAII